MRELCRTLFSRVSREVVSQVPRKIAPVSRSCHEKPVFARNGKRERVGDTEHERWCISNYLVSSAFSRRRSPHCSACRVCSARILGLARRRSPDRSALIRCLCFDCHRSPVCSAFSSCLRFDWHCSPFGLRCVLVFAFIVIDLQVRSWLFSLLCLPSFSWFLCFVSFGLLAVVLPFAVRCFVGSFWLLFGFIWGGMKSQMLVQENEQTLQITEKRHADAGLDL